MIIAQLTRNGILLSWAVEGQGGRFHVNEQNNTAIVQVPRQRKQHRHPPGTTSTNRTSPPSSRYHVNEQNNTAIVQVPRQRTEHHRHRPGHVQQGGVIQPVLQFSKLDTMLSSIFLRRSISEKSASLAAKLSFSKNRKCLKYVGGFYLQNPFLYIKEKWAKRNFEIIKFLNNLFWLPKWAKWVLTL